MSKGDAGLSLDSESEDDSDQNLDINDDEKEFFKRRINLEARHNMLKRCNSENILLMEYYNQGIFPGNHKLIGSHLQRLYYPAAHSGSTSIRSAGSSIDRSFKLNSSYDKAGEDTHSVTAQVPQSSVSGGPLLG